MKKLLFVFIILLLVGCDDKFASEPSLKESERMAVLQKAQIDTLTTIVEMDDYLYTIKDGQIQGRELKENKEWLTFILGMLVMLLISFIVVGSIDN